MKRYLQYSKLVLVLGLVFSGFAYADSASSLSSSQQPASETSTPTTVVSPDPNSTAVPVVSTLPAPTISPGQQEPNTVTAAPPGGEQQPVYSQAPVPVPQQQSSVVQGSPPPQYTDQAPPDEQGPPPPQYTDQAPPDEQGPPPQQYSGGPGYGPSSGSGPNGPEGRCPGFVPGHYAQNNSWIPSHCPGQVVFVKAYYNQNGEWIPGHWIKTAHRGEARYSHPGYTDSYGG